MFRRPITGTRGEAMQDEIKFHSDRAIAEIDLARKAADANAARAHLNLSQLHLRRMRELSNGARPKLSLFRG